MKNLVVLSTLGFLMLAGTASAHTPICACYDEGDGTILCEGGFSDGSSAAGVALKVLDADDNILLEGKMSEDSEFEFEKPKVEYKVLFDAGEGHKITINGNDIVE